MKTIIRSAFAAAIGVAAVISLGCAGMPGVPGALPSGMPGAVAGPNAPATVGAACTAASPAATPAKGLDKHGKYKDQLLPNAWDNLADEAAVTAAFDKAKSEATNWPCQNKFYAGAVTIYNSIKGIT